MTLSEDEKARLADVVQLQPTKNKQLQDRWGLDSGSAVHQYLENHLQEYYYRDDNSLIRATDEAANVADVDPGIEGDDIPSVIRVSPLQASIFEHVAGPDARSQSVVSVLQTVREVTEEEPTVDDVREALESLRRKGVLERIYRTVPTYRCITERESIDVERLGAVDTDTGTDTDTDTAIIERIESDFQLPD